MKIYVREEVSIVHNHTGGKRLTLALLLGLLAIMGPLIIDMYLPSFLGIATDLETSAKLVQTSLSDCLLVLAIGQLVIGPISDEQGRIKSLLIATSLFLITSILCAFALNIIVLIAARFLQ